MSGVANIRYNGKAQAGLTLVELMVTLVISSLILAGVLTLMMNNGRAVRTQEEIGFIQENARFAMELLSRDVRMAGYFGCGTGANLAVTIDGDTSGFLNFVAVEGFGATEADSEWPAEVAADKTDGTDGFIIRSGDFGHSLTVESHNGNSAVIHIQGTHDYTPGTVMVMSDSSCRQVGIFGITGPTNSDGTAGHMVHNKGAAGPVENCSKMLWGSFDCGDCNNSGNNCGPDGTTKSFGAGSELMAFSAQAYYIAPSSIDPEMPALYRRRLDNGGAISAEELVVGVDNMRILYGLDLSSPDKDNQVDRYMRAEDIDHLKAEETADNIAWDRVTALKITLVMSSFGSVYPSAKSVTLAGIQYNDRFLRQTVTTTVQLRNSGTIGGT